MTKTSQSFVPILILAVFLPAGCDKKPTEPLNRIDRSPDIPRLFSMQAYAEIEGPATITEPGQYRWCVSLYGAASGVYHAKVNTPNYSGWTSFIPPSTGCGAYTYIGPGYLDLVVYAEVQDIHYQVVAYAGPYHVAVDIPVPPPVLEASIQGPTEIEASTPCTWNALVSHGTPPYSYSWKRDGQVVSQWSQYTASSGGGTFQLQLTVTDSASALISDAINVHETPYATVCAL